MSKAKLLKALDVFVQRMTDQINGLSEYDAKRMVSEGFGPDTCINTAIYHAKQLIGEEKHVDLACEVFYRWYRDSTKLEPVGFRPSTEFVGKLVPYEMIQAPDNHCYVFLRFDTSGQAVCLSQNEGLKCLEGGYYNVQGTCSWSQLQRLH